MTTRETRIQRVIVFTAAALSNLSISLCIREYHTHFKTSYVFMVLGMVFGLISVTATVLDPEDLRIEE